MPNYTKIALLILVIYSGLYVLLSVNGRFEAGAIGLQAFQAKGRAWPKDYIWMPKYFVNDKGENNILFRLLYSPAFFLDAWLWHSGRYPEVGDPINPLWVK